MHRDQPSRKYLGRGRVISLTGEAPGRNHTFVRCEVGKRASDRTCDGLGAEPHDAWPDLED